MQITLNPLLITGEINISTPICVIEYVLSFCKISFNADFMNNQKYIQQINEAIASYKFITVEFNINETNTVILKEYCRLLNPRYRKSWNSISIINGMKTIIRFLSPDLVDFSNLELIFGEKTNITPEKINEAMTYRICKQNDYSMSLTTDFSEMVFAASNFLTPTEIPKIRKNVLENVKYLPNANIIKLAYDFSKIEPDEEFEITESVNPSEINTQVVDANRINTVATFFSDPKILVTRIIPDTPIEAIYLAMVIFEICIADSKNPIKQFEYLKSKRFSCRNVEKYVPFSDPEFMVLYTRNPRWYRTNTNWFECFMGTYSINRLITFARNEGFTETNVDKRTLVDFLNERHQVSNFYFDIVPFCDKKETVYKTPIDEVPLNQLICLGPLNNLYYYTVEELIDSFISNKMFINPITKDQIDMFAINKLVNHLSICSSEFVEDRHIFNNAISVINDINKIRKNIDLSVGELKFTIQEMQPYERDQIERFFMSIIDMGFYMRGWKIAGENLPINSIETNYDVTLQDQVCANTWEAYKKYRRLYAELDSNIKSSISQLNLMRFSYQGKSEQIFNMTFRGISICRTKTLLECIQDSVTGNYDSEESCIRSNSNWIIFSAAWYCYIFGFTVPFCFDRLDEIS